jgi:hypothetical protein
MSENRHKNALIDRRRFLKHASIGTAAVSVAGLASPAGVTAQEKRALPTVRLGAHTITRLITGYNPVGGFSHATPYLSRHMREYFTVERTVEFLRHCEELGINAFQFDLCEKGRKVIDILWSGGSKLQFICLHSTRPGIAPLDEAIRYKPIAIAHHGGVTDGMFRTGKADKVHDFLKEVHDLGLLAGVSSHCPANIARIEDEGWETDFYMTCFHYLSRTREDMMKEFGAVIFPEPYIESDPVKMTEVIRQVDKPCLAFKILAAGRKCGSQAAVGQAFKFAFDHIKPGDAVIVGMFPRYEDEVQYNVHHTLEHGVT